LRLASSPQRPAAAWPKEDAKMDGSTASTAECPYCKTLQCQGLEYSPQWPKPDQAEIDAAIRDMPRLFYNARPYGNSVAMGFDDVLKVLSAGGRTAAAAAWAVQELVGRGLLTLHYRLPSAAFPYRRASLPLEYNFLVMPRPAFFQEIDRNDGASMDGSASHAAVEEGADDSYVSATNLPGWHDHFPTYRKLKKYFDEHQKQIRQQRKPRRLMVHAADWAREMAARKEEKFEQLDNEAEAVLKRPLVKSRPTAKK
jgi:hypothetical protein